MDATNLCLSIPAGSSCFCLTNSAYQKSKYTKLRIKKNC